MTKQEKQQTVTSEKIEPTNIYYFAGKMTEIMNRLSK